MKKFLVLLPLLLIAWFVLTWCDTSDTQQELAQLQQNLNDVIEKNNMLTEKLREQEANYLAEWLSQEEEAEEEVVPVYEEVTSDTVSNTVTSDFGNQPTSVPGNYVGNTEQLNEYAHRHMVKAHVDGSTMVIKLKKPVADARRNIIVYVSVPWVWHCWGRIIGNEMWEIMWKDTFSFDISDMDLPGTACDGNWFKHIWNKDILVWGYVTSYDGNWFSSVSFN